MELYDVRATSSVLTPHYLDRIASLLPEKVGLTTRCLIDNTTIYPYFHPFLPAVRGETFIGYLKGTQLHDYFALGMGKMRYPKTTQLRFCKSCWREETETFGEPFWRRLHQLPGVLVCPSHQAPLLESPISLLAAQKAYYPASLRLVEKSTICGEFSDLLTEKLLAIAQDSQWLLENGLQYGPYEDTYARFIRYFYNAGLSTLSGQLKQKEINVALQEHFGVELLKLMDAYDESIGTLWTIRIPHIMHPLFHIFLTELLATSTADFFQQDCPEILPYGPAPWPCHNTTCPGYLKDVIAHYDSNPYHGCMHARFECPLCGMVYHRKKAMSKEDQYVRKPKIFSYGPLWEATLREHLIEHQMTARETSQAMGCDFYTVNRYALSLGILSRDEVYLFERTPKIKEPEPLPIISSEQELREKYRKQWLDLMERYPGASRNQLIRTASVVTCYKWLRKHDTDWYEKNSPSSRRIYFDWDKKDAERLEKLRAALKKLVDTPERPKWISRNALIALSGVHQLARKKSLDHMPLTSAFLQENLETREKWQKRKVIWAIRRLQTDGQTLTPHKILATASIATESIDALGAFIEEQIFACQLQA